MKKLLSTEIPLAAEFLRQGIPVAFPTETVYGLGAPVFNVGAVEKIFQMKGRPSDNPLICHIASIDQLYELACEVPEAALKLAAHFWPGPLTMVLKKQEKVPAIVTGGQETVAIRMPRHPIALELIRQVGEPLVAPSANKSGRPSSTTAEHVLSDFEDGIVIDGGPAEGGLESTVLYLAGELPLILRPGLITSEAISEVLGCEVRSGQGEVQNASPGSRYRHYAPKATVRIVHSIEEALCEERCEERAFLMSTQKHPAFHHLTASSFYALLRQADIEGYDAIIVVCNDLNDKGDEALMDRLLRAAGLC
ncbi:MAG: threonylcarbamoyl-AMP synthase [Rhabdochlamydiaceae bacterium]|nr:threonylcarbamoyl-AMP synthase [Rhabdochlamydiaceae bacterium]